MKKIKNKAPHYTGLFYDYLAQALKNLNNSPF